MNADRVKGTLEKKLERTVAALAVMVFLLGAAVLWKNIAAILAHFAAVS